MWLGRERPFKSSLDSDEPPLPGNLRQTAALRRAEREVVGRLSHWLVPRPPVAESGSSHPAPPWRDAAKTATDHSRAWSTAAVHPMPVWECTYKRSGPRLIARHRQAAEASIIMSGCVLHPQSARP